MKDKLFEYPLMFFSQNTTNLGQDHYGLGEKLLEYDNDDKDINRIISRIYNIKSKGIKITPQKNIVSDVEGVLLDIEFVLSIYPTDKDHLKRKSSIICCGKLVKLNYLNSKINSEEFKKTIDTLEAEILKKTKIFADKISRTLPDDLKKSGSIKYFLEQFYHQRDIVVFKRKITNQWFWFGGLVVLFILILFINLLPSTIFMSSPPITVQTPGTSYPGTTTTSNPPTQSTSPKPQILPPKRQILRLGMEGSDVRLLQKKLIDLGYLKGKNDGIFGDKTKAAVEAFQNFHKLKTDGVVGSATWKALLE